MSGDGSAAILARRQELFDAKLASLGLDLPEEERQRLWASHLKQIELAADWTARLDPCVEPALEFRAVECPR